MIFRDANTQNKCVVTGTSGMSGKNLCLNFLEKKFSDDEDISTTELLHCMCLALGKPSRLIQFPAQLLQLGALILGKRNLAQQLPGNLQAGISKTKTILGWAPPASVNEGLRKTAEWYLSQR